MTTQWSASAKTTEGSRSIKFGPMKDELPSAFTVSAEAKHYDLKAELDCRFDGDRVEVLSLRLAHGSGEPMSARDLTRVQMGEIVRTAAEAAVNPGHGAFVGRRPDRKPTMEELELLSAVYWFGHVTNGSPRQTIMAIWGLSRATANRWITKAAESYPMPLRLNELED